MSIRFLVVAMGCATLLGCGLHSDYQRPDLDLPATFSSQAQIPLQDKWWQAFNDPALNRLVDDVLAANPDMALAGIKLKQAGLGLELAQGNQRPEINAGLGANTQRPLDRHFDTRWTGNAQLGLNYELDVWGRLSSATDAARWEADATAEDRDATRLMIIGKTLESYWQLAYLHQAITSGEQDLANQHDVLAITERRLAAGAVSRLDLLQAKQSLAGKQASQLELLNQQEAARNTLLLLLGRGHGALPVAPSSLPDTLPDPAPGLPAEVLSRRPDMRAAESRLRRQLAEADSTRASFYPTLSLTGRVGSSSNALATLLQNPMGSLGVSLALPFLEWNKRQQTIDRANLDYDAAVINFRKQLYQSLVEVDNALSDVRIGREREQRLQEQLTLERESARLARSRYLAGATGVQNWLDEQSRLRSAELAWLKQRSSLLVAQSRLCQALGGGLHP